MMYCGECGARVEPDDTYCGTCGSVTARLAASVPPPPNRSGGVVPPVVAAGHAPPPASSSRRRVSIALAAAAVLVLAAGTTVFVLTRTNPGTASVDTPATRPTDSDEAPGTAPASTTTIPTTEPAPVVTTTTTVPPTTLPPTTISADDAALARLEELVNSDRALADQLVGGYVPQVSAKYVGLVYDGVTYTPELVLADHLALRARYDAILVDASAFQFRNNGAPMTGWYLTIVPVRYDILEDAKGWCAAEGLPPADCFGRPFEPPW